MKKPKKILLIDDDDTSNYVSEIIISLVDQSIRVDKLTNGKDAIQHFSMIEEPPDLVLLDINMPFIDGFEFLDYYARQNWNGRTKFAIYSTSSREVDKHRALKYDQVIDYIEKPLNEEKLTLLFKKYADK